MNKVLPKMSEASAVKGRLGLAGPRNVALDWRKLLRRGLFLLLPVALVIGGYEYMSGGQVVSTDDAYVQADMVGIATDVPGIVAEIAVRDNQPVKAGDVLFRLDDLPFRLALQRADSQISNVRNELIALQASYRGMHAQIAQAKADVAYFAKEMERKRQLARSDYASPAAFDQAQHNFQVAQQKLVELGQQLDGIAANLNGDPDAPVEQHPRYRDAVTARDEFARQLSHTVVRAPMDGVAAKVSTLQVGQYLPAGTAAFSVVATDHAWIEASPKETELTYMRAGQPVTVTADTYPGVVWNGTVDSISPASGASFSLLPAQNTSGNWVKVVQRIPVRVRIDTPDSKPPLRVGMSVTVEVDTGHPRGLFGSAQAKSHE